MTLHAFPAMRFPVLAGLGACAVAFAVSDVVNREMSPVAEVVSRFVNTHAGWLVTVGMYGLALASAVFTVGVARTRASRTGSWLFGIWSAGLLLAAVFPADPPGRWDDPSVSETIHGLAAWVALLAFLAAAVLLTRRWRREPGMPGALTAVTAAVVLGMILFVITMVDVMGARALPSVIGLTERIVLAADVAWIAVATIGLTRSGGARR
ncbi:DUF998 domain-containing protein [Planotetraspora mira]|uniref:DUF998 domain-containing protein n=1 Tax=Planotetraspora mira TaxID=58121 RepID=A0A8J3TSQ2_9ACTN|nr:DUF998 domain-containing protein [Planotetraspora mira]GII32350.1 hypothetical protein Pmi06nite_57920 [Planotetraspora mira]